MGPEPPFVLDASALLAFLQAEPGADEVDAVLEGSVISAVNLSEAIQKAEQHGSETEGLEYDLPALGVRVQPFDALDARPVADLWFATRDRGLSLGDRACLSLTSRLGGTAMTTDRAWSGLDGVNIRLIR